MESKIHVKYLFLLYFDIGNISLNKAFLKIVLQEDVILVWYKIGILEGQRQSYYTTLLHAYD